MTTKNLPVDKNGNVYYGPTTYAAAVAQIDAGRDAADTANMLESAGYVGIARRIRREYIVTTVCGKTIQIDRSGGQGHCWRTIDRDDIPADIVEEIEGEIIDGKQQKCSDFVGSNGQHYRW